MDRNDKLMFLVLLLAVSFTIGMGYLVLKEALALLR
jgi:hypothetical protein